MINFALKDKYPHYITVGLNFSQSVLDKNSCLHYLLPPPRTGFVDKLRSHIHSIFLKLLKLLDFTIHLYPMPLIITNLNYPCATLDVVYILIIIRYVLYVFLAQSNWYCFYFFISFSLYIFSIQHIDAAIINKRVCVQTERFLTIAHHCS